MTSNHYHTLGVAPWAEDAVIRAAYVALMRTYHPDRNRDPKAQTRVREITGAFEVLGDPHKRAAYDALRALRQETGIGGEVHRPPRPPMRNLGIASVVLAVVVTLTFAAWPQAEPMPDGQLHRVAVATSQKPHVAIAALDLPEASEMLPPVASDAPAVASPPKVKPIVPEARAPEVVAPQPKSHTPLVQRRQIARAAFPKAPVATPAVPIRTAAITPAARPAPHCAGQCMADRKVQVERIASGFLRQSLDHADSHKQELLLSASRRSATSRSMCHSDECVTNAYLRQIRETTAIVEGRTPTQ